jgi:hypothetical protein
MRKTIFVLALITLIATTACNPAETDIDRIPQVPGDLPQLTATVTGRIIWEGAAPLAKRLPTSADPSCKNPGLLSEEYVVSDGGLENVMLYVSSGMEGKTFSAPKESVTLDQKGCQYVPHVLTIQTNQPLLITNSDETAHNIHAWAVINPSFNESQASKGQKTTKIFTKEEILLPLRCDVHNWMSAFIGVFAHPSHTVSRKGGAYELKLPAGKYTITAHHETGGKQEAMMEVAENSTLNLNFTFKAK